MASISDQPQRPGLPDPASIIEEVPFNPPQQTEPGAVGAQAATVYTILRTTELDPYEEPQTVEDIMSAFRAVPVSDNFAGTARKAAKLSIGSGAVENIPDLRDLINSLPQDSDMRNHNPPITQKPTSRRVREENRNVRVAAFLYAASRENDNDFHLIVGRNPTSAPPIYMTMEISGLPTKTSNSYNTLKAARDSFTQFFGTDLPGTSYDFYDPPIPIQIQGSLFFDITHLTGPHPGPASLRPNIPTIWELHPVTDIVFES